MDITTPTPEVPTAEQLAFDARRAYVQHLQDLRHGSAAQPVPAIRRDRGRGSRSNQRAAAIRESRGY